MLSVLMLAFVIIAVAIKTNAGNCPESNTSACTGVCVAVMGASGTVSHYKCDTGPTGAKKDCTESGVNGGGDEYLEPAP